MTFGEILARVNFLVWGNSTPPTGTTAQLSGDEGIIADIHRNIQEDYNYWIMRADVVIPTVVDTQAYTLPTNFKEMIDMTFKVDGEDYWGPKLEPVDKRVEIELWQRNNSDAEYPTHFAFYNATVVLYPKPSAIRNLHVMYWKYFDRPSAFTSTASTDNDDLTTHAGKAISYLAAAEMCWILDEFQKAQHYETKGEQAVALLKRHDVKNRQAIFASEIDYSGY